MRTKYVIVGMDSEQKLVALGDRYAKPYDSAAQANKAVAQARSDHRRFEFVVIPVQAGPRV